MSDFLKPNFKRDPGTQSADRGVIDVRAADEIRRRVTAAAKGQNSGIAVVSVLGDIPGGQTITVPAGVTLSVAGNEYSLDIYFVIQPGAVLEIGDCQVLHPITGAGRVVATKIDFSAASAVAIGSISEWTLIECILPPVITTDAITDCRISGTRYDGYAAVACGQITESRLEITGTLTSPGPIRSTVHLVGNWVAVPDLGTQSSVIAWNVASGGGGGSGTVTNVSVVPANGLAGTVANPTTTPAITLSTTANGLLQGNGTAISAATIGTGLSFASGTLSNTQIGLTDGDKGDITVASSGASWTVDANAITNGKLADVPTASFKGRVTAGTGDPEDLTGTQATALLDTFTSSLKGLAPASGGGTTNFLRADGTWAAPADDIPYSVAPAIAVTGGSVITYDGYIVRPINISGSGSFTVSTAGVPDGALMLLVVETVSGTALIETDANVHLHAREWLPESAGEVITLQYVASLGYWAETSRSITYDSSAGFLAKNSSGSTITRGKLVYINGAVGNNPLIVPADFSSEATSAGTVGMVYDDIPNNQFGHVITVGIVRRVNTNGIAAGAPVYLGAAGAFTAVKPSAPNHMVKVGNVVRVSATVGTIQVQISNGWELDELHDVDIDGAAKGNLLVRNNANLWQNFAVGADGYALTAASAATTGLTWSRIIGLTDGDKGDITVASSGASWTVDANAITNTKLADMATATFKGRVTAGSGDPEDITGTQATTLLDVFTTSLKGLAPASGGGTSNFLRADGTWAAPAGSGGTVTNVSVVSANGLAGTVANPTTTPAITLSTTVTGVLKGDGYGAIVAAVPGTDFAPAGNYVTLDTVQTITATKSIDVSSTAAALRITQTGTGEALRVEDSANPDTSPFVINRDGKVGIGTSSPAYSLSITGTGTGRADIGPWSTSANYAAIFLNGSTVIPNNYNVLSGTGDQSLYINRPPNEFISFRMANTEQMILDDNGRLGIGTGSPTSLLHVAGDARADNFHDGTGTFNVNLANGGSNGAEGMGLVVGYSGLSYAGIGFNVRHTATTDTYICPMGNTSNYLRFDQGFQFLGEPSGANNRTASYTELMRITNAGLVGIGTGTPAAMLSVGATSQFRVDNSGNLVRVNDVPYSWPATQGTTSTVLTNNGSGTLSWGAPSTGSVTTVSVVSANGLAGSVANPTTTPAITLSTTVTGLLKGNGTAISAAVAGTDYAPAGNYVTLDTVQIITARKTVSLSNALPALTITQSGAGAALDVAAGGVRIPDGSAAAPAIAFRDDTNTGIFSPTNDIFGISVNGSEAVRVLESGSTPVMLIGTSTVYGAITVDSNSAAGTSGVVMLGHANAGTVLQESYRGGQFAGVRSRGTKDNPAGVQTGDGLVNMVGAGVTSTGGINYGALITMKAAETFTSTASGGRIEFHTTTNGTNGFTTLGGAGTARMIISPDDVTIQPPDDLILAPGDALIGTGSTITLTAGTTATVSGTTSVSLNTSAQKVETTTTAVNIEAASAGADITITAADNITNTVGHQSLFKVVDITAGDISTFDYEQIINTVPLRGPDGSAAAPAYSFTGGTGTGMWRSGKALNFAVDGGTILSLNDNAAGDQIQSVPDGTVARPAYTWVSATDTGFYYDTTDTYIGLSIGGTRRLLLDASGMTSAIIGGPTIPWGAGTTAAPTYAFFGDGDTGMYRPAANQVAFATGGDVALLLSAAAVTSAYTPSIITNDTGMSLGHNSSARTLTLNTASTPRVTIAGNGNYVEIDSALVYEPGATEELKADNGVVTVGARSYIKFESDSAAPTARTFTISNGVRTGQVLIIHCTAGSAEILDTGNVQIAGTMTFNASRTLSLIWGGSSWVETSRAL